MSDVSGRVLFQEPTDYGEPPALLYLANESLDLLSGELFASERMEAARDRVWAAARELILACGSYRKFVNGAALQPVGVPFPGPAPCRVAPAAESFCAAMNALWSDLAALALPHLQARDCAAAEAYALRAFYRNHDTILEMRS